MSYVDAVLVIAACARPIRFVMDHRIFQVPVLNWLFKLAKAIPIAPRKEDPALKEAAFDAAAKALRAGDRWHLPRGLASRTTASLQEFKGGIMKVLEREPRP